MRTVRHILSWALAALLIAAFVHISLHPLPDPASGQVLLFDPIGDNITFSTLADRSGYPVFEPGIRVITGLMLVLISALLLMPWTRTLGGFLAMLIVGAVVAAHLSPWLGQEVPTGIDDQLDGGRQFSLMIALLVASVLVTIVHPSRKKR